MRLEILEEVDSTQIYLKQKLANGTLNDLDFVLAKYQSKGYGRFSRNWLSLKEQSMLLSFSLESSPLLEESQLAFLIATSISRVLTDSFDISPFFKWPNDVMVFDKKIAGILIEKEADFYIIGLGVNLNQENFSDDQEQGAISLYQAIEKKVKIEDFFYLFYKVFIQQLESLKKKEFSPLKEISQTLLYQNQQVALFDMEGQIKASGKLIGLDDIKGSLILENSKGEKSSHYAGTLRPL